MSTIAVIAIEEGIRFALKEFVAWQSQRAREAGWKPSPADVEAFLQGVRADTPARIEAEARQELGLPAQ